MEQIIPPKEAQILLADSYLDRLTFLPEKRKDGRAEIIGAPYVKAELPGGEEWRVRWNEEKHTITCDGEEKTVSLKEWNRGFNHMIMSLDGSHPLNDKVDGDPQHLPPGDSAISWTGTVARLVVTPNWRFYDACYLMKCFEFWYNKHCHQASSTNAVKKSRARQRPSLYNTY